MPSRPAASSGKGSPGKRRGRRGPNSGGRKHMVTTEEMRQDAESAANESLDDQAARRRRQVESVAESARMKNKAALGIMTDQLAGMLAQRDFLLRKMHANDITSEENVLLTGLNQKVMKALQTMGVTELRDPDECPACGGSRVGPDGKMCLHCNGRGYV